MYIDFHNLMRIESYFNKSTGGVNGRRPHGFIVFSVAAVAVPKKVK